MADSESKFQEMIQEDRTNREMTDWKGRFIEYLELVKAGSLTCQTGTCQNERCYFEGGSYRHP